MSDSLTSLLPGAGTPEGEAIVNAREFDLTQVVKKLTVAIPLVLAATIGALKTAGVEEATDWRYIVAGLGVTAFAVLSLGIVSAADILARGYVEASKSPTNVEEKKKDAAVDAVPDRQDRLAKDAQEREDRLEKERRDRQDRLDKEALDRHDRLERERLEREDRLAKEARERDDRRTNEVRERGSGPVSEGRRVPNQDVTAVDQAEDPPSG